MAAEAKQREILKAVEQVQDGQRPVEGNMLVDEGGVVVIVARGELGDELFDFYCERSAARRVQ